MQTNNSQLGKYIKYIIFAGIIYGVLKVVPTNQLSNFEICSLVTVILFAIFSLESLTAVPVDNTENLDKVHKCTNNSSLCVYS